MTPSVIAEAASQIATVLADPCHQIYGKANKFLNKAPSWDAQKVISYWIDRVLLKEPEADDGHDVEVGWLLELLVNSLRTPAVSCCILGWPLRSLAVLQRLLESQADPVQDMELYRRANVFERVLSLYCSPQLSTKLRHKILQVVYRAVQAGGSMTLITRAGVLSWIEIQTSLNAKDMAVLDALKMAMVESSDVAEVEVWKTRVQKS